MYDTTPEKPERARDKFLTKQMNTCDHDWVGSEDISGETWISCSKCRRTPLFQHDFTNWTGFGLLLEWLEKQEYYFEFVASQNCLNDSRFYTTTILSPNTFADRVYNFLMEKQK